MKCILILLCTVIVGVLGETCSQTSDCTLTVCADATHSVICANHECTCSSGQNGQTCTDTHSCSSTHCRTGNAHCVDGQCHCIHNGGGGQPGQPGHHPGGK